MLTQGKKCKVKDENAKKERNINELFPTFAYLFI